MKDFSKYKSIILLGILLACLLVCMKFFQYRYYIGNLNTEVYTGVVAGLFTILGIGIGIKLLSPGKTPAQEPKEESEEIDYKKIEELDIKEREYEILKLVSTGLSNKEIAEQLFIAIPTVKTHTSNLYSKLDVKSRTQAVHKARSMRLI